MRNYIRFSVWLRVNTDKSLESIALFNNSIFMHICFNIRTYLVSTDLKTDQTDKCERGRKRHKLEKKAETEAKAEDVKVEAMSDGS